MSKVSRRNVLKTLGATAGVSTLAMSSLATEKEGTTEEDKKMKIIVVGAHPDDPETNCGGIMSLFTNNGHEVISAYLTRGEAGLPGVSYDEAAKMRTTEALEACKVLGARPIFLGQIDGNTEIVKDSYSTIFSLFEKEKPDVVFTHWPIDTHRDHRICSTLVYDAWLSLGKKFELFYSESMSGMQSQCFQPDTYVDITEVVEQKHKACFCHKCQNIEELYAMSHEHMEIFRGMESNCKYAEAFVSHPQNPNRVDLYRLI